MENNYQLSRIHNYVHGLMNPEEMYNLEREALDDPFLQDAIDGYKLQNGVDSKKLSLLQQRLANRIEQQVDTRKRQFYSWQRLAVAMTAGVLFVAVCTLVLMRYFTKNQGVDLVQVHIMPDEVFDIKLEFLSDNDVNPEKGWETFREYLEHDLSLDSSKEIKVAFQVDQNGYAFNIAIDSENKALIQELNGIIKNKYSWSGKHANFIIKLHKVNMN